MLLGWMISSVLHHNASFSDTRSLQFILTEAAATATGAARSDHTHQQPQDVAAMHDCLTTQLPAWVHHGPQHLAHQMWEASQGQTDKVGNPVNRNDRHSHQYQLLYWPYLSKLVTRHTCGHHLLQPERQPQKQEPLRLLEIGLGCNPQRVGVGGSALAWHSLLMESPASQDDPRNVELYILEYDEGCARAWEQENPGVVTQLLTGDASSPAELRRAMEQISNPRFDVIIDDGSHINNHQITTMQFFLNDTTSDDEGYLKPGGLYVIEDIESSCYDWPANVGQAQRGPGTGGSRDCLTQKKSKTIPAEHPDEPTILGVLVEYQKQLLQWKRGKAPFQGSITHIDIHWGGAVLEKRLPGF